MSDPKIKSFFWITDSAEEAATFWVSTFANSSISSTMNEPCEGGSVIIAEFALDGVPFVAMSTPGAPPSTMQVSQMVRCADQAEVDRLWDALGAGGQFGQCGWLTDRYGITWQIIPDGMTALISDPNPARAQAASQAMMQMSKIELDVMRAAADAAG